MPGCLLEHDFLLWRQGIIALRVHLPEVLRSNVHDARERHRVCFLCAPRKYLPTQCSPLLWSSDQEMQFSRQCKLQQASMETVAVEMPRSFSTTRSK